MGPDTPVAFGLHPNAEIDFRTTQSELAFATLLELQPREAGSDEGAASPMQVAEMVAADVMDRFGEKKFDVDDIARSLDDQGPYQNVFMQEMDVHNVLLAEIVRSLNELKLGFAGELTMSDAMEALLNALYMDAIPASWAKRAWPSKRGLVSWLSNFTQRLNQLDEWSGNPMEIPKVTWLSGLVNPQSFLTAINQVAAQKDKSELDKLVSVTDVTKKMAVDEIDGHARDGAYINGLQMEGARWDVNNTSVEFEAEGDVFADARHVGQGRPGGQGRHQGHVRVPDVQDADARADLRLPGAAQDEVAARALGPRRCRAHHGPRLITQRARAEAAGVWQQVDCRPSQAPSIRGEHRRPNDHSPTPPRAVLTRRRLRSSQKAARLRGHFQCKITSHTRPCAVMVTGECTARGQSARSIVELALVFATHACGSSQSKRSFPFSTSSYPCPRHTGKPKPILGKNIERRRFLDDEGCRVAGAAHREHLRELSDVARLVSKDQALDGDPRGSCQHLQVLLWSCYP